MNNWEALSTFLFIIIFIYYNLIVGRAVLTFLKVESNRALSFITGIMVLFAADELVSLPFMLLKGSYDALFIITSLALGIIFITSCCYLFINKKDFSILQINYKYIQNPYFVVFAILLIVSTVFPAIFAKFDGDDAFYIAVSTSIKTTGRIFFNNPSIGLDQYVYPVHYQFTCYEVFMAYIADVFHVEPVVVFHTFIPAIVVPASYVAFLALAHAFFPKEKEKTQLFFAIIMSLLTLFSRYSGFLPGIFLMSRGWMGKSFMVNVCFPALVCYFVYAIREQEKYINYHYFFSSNSDYFLLISISLIAGVGLSAVGMFLMPIYYFLLFLSALLFCKGNLEFRFNLIVKAFLSVIPTICILLGFLLTVLHSNQLGLIETLISDRSWWDDVRLPLNDNIGIIGLYFLGIFYYLFYGNIYQRIVFIIEPVLLLLTFGNPLFRNFVGTYLTTLSVYWRLFWLVPVFWTIASFLTSTFINFKNSNLKWLLIIPIIIICNINDFVFNINNYAGPENAGKIPGYIETTVETIKENVNTDDPNDLYLLALPKYNMYIRQKTGDIALVMPRVNYVQEAYKLNGIYPEYEKIRNLFAYDKSKIIRGYTPIFNTDDLRNLNISLIISEEERFELEDDYNRVKLPDGDNLYIRKDISKTPAGYEYPTGSYPPEINPTD